MKPSQRRCSRVLRSSLLTYFSLPQLTPATQTIPPPPPSHVHRHARTLLFSFREKKRKKISISRFPRFPPRVSTVVVSAEIVLGGESLGAPTSPHDRILKGRWARDDTSPTRGSPSPVAREIKVRDISRAVWGANSCGGEHGVGDHSEQVVASAANSAE